MDEKSVKLIGQIGAIGGLFVVGFVVGDLVGLNLKGMDSFWFVVDHSLKNYLPALAPAVILIVIVLILRSRSAEDAQRQQRRTKSDLLAVLFELETATQYLKTEFRKLDDLIGEKKPQNAYRVRSIMVPVPYAMPDSDIRQSLAELPPPTTAIILQAYHSLKAHNDFQTVLSPTKDYEVQDMVSSARRAAFTGSRVATAALRLSKVLPVGEAVRRSLAATAAMFKDGEDQMADVEERPTHRPLRAITGAGDSKTAAAASSSSSASTAEPGAEGEQQAEKPKGGSARAAEIRAALNKKKSFRPTAKKAADDAS